MNLAIETLQQQLMHVKHPKEQFVHDETSYWFAEVSVLGFQF